MHACEFPQVCSVCALFHAAVALHVLVEAVSTIPWISHKPKHIVVTPHVGDVSWILEKVLPAAVHAHACACVEAMRADIVALTKLIHNAGGRGFGAADIDVLVPAQGWH